MESSQNTAQSYALALLTLVGSQEGADDDNPLFGFAIQVRHVKRSTVYHQTAHRLLRALIQHSPSPEAVADQFLTELARCENTKVETLINNLNAGDNGSVSPDEWAADVCRELIENGGNLTPVTELASYYLTHLIIAFRKPSGTSTQDSLPHTPDLDRAEQFGSLLDSAAIPHDQPNLKELVLLRDGPSCVVTGALFEGYGRVRPDCAYIIPCSFNDKALVLTAIKMFTSNKVNADIVREFLNNPANAINLEVDAHHSMDLELAWGIEAKLDNNEWKYYFRAVRMPDVPKIVHNFITDGDEIHFGRGNDGATIPLPDPRLCNLHLAVARVFAASGYSEVVERYLADEDRDVGTGHFSDELTRRLQALLLLG